MQGGSHGEGWTRRGGRRVATTVGGGKQRGEQSEEEAWQRRLCPSRREGERGERSSSSIRRAQPAAMAGFYSRHRSVCGENYLSSDHGKALAGRQDKVERRWSTRSQLSGPFWGARRRAPRARGGRRHRTRAVLHRSQHWDIWLEEGDEADMRTSHVFGRGKKRWEVGCSSSWARSLAPAHAEGGNG